MIVECSTWLFPAIILSGVCAPLILIINLFGEWFGLW